MHANHKGGILLFHLHHNPSPHTLRNTYTVGPKANQFACNFPFGEETILHEGDDNYLKKIITCCTILEAL